MRTSTILKVTFTEMMQDSKSRANLEAHGVSDGVCDLSDGDLILLAHRQDDGVGLLVLAQHPDHEACQVQVVDKLAPASSR